MAVEREERQRLLLEWSLLTDGQRITFGYPVDRASFAKSIGSSDKTLQRDQQEPAFQETLAARKREIAQLAMPGAVLDASDAAKALVSIAAAGSGLAENADQYVPEAMATLMELVKAKDRGAIQILLSTPAAKAYFDAMLKDKTSEFSSMTPLELARANCEYIPTSILAEVLAEREAGQ